MLVGLAERQRRDEEARPRGDDRERGQRLLRTGVEPRPQVIVRRLPPADLRLAPAGVLEAADITWRQGVVPVGQRPEGKLAPGPRDEAQLIAVADWDAHLLPVLVDKDVV